MSVYACLKRSLLYQQNPIQDTDISSLIETNHIGLHKMLKITSSSVMGEK